METSLYCNSQSVSHIAPCAEFAPSPNTLFMCLLVCQVTIVEKADSSNVLPSPLSISTKNRMTFLFANLKDRDFLVQRISDFLQQTTSKICFEREITGSLNSSDDEVGICSMGITAHYQGGI